jgi:hypothetical protein
VTVYTESVAKQAGGRSARVSPMSDEHKAALVAGREEARIVRAYLEALEATRKRGRGRKRTLESVSGQLTKIESLLNDGDPLLRLQYLQDRADLLEELQSLKAPGENIAVLRQAFVGVARRYSDRKGISHSTWREFGVDAATLKEAGIGHERMPSK